MKHAPNKSNDVMFVSCAKKHIPATDRVKGTDCGHLAFDTVSIFVSVIIPMIVSVSVSIPVIVLLSVYLC